MNFFSRWMKYSSPLVKGTMAIAVTSGVVVVHKWFYSPYVRRQRLLQAEEWANSIIEEEERMQEHENNS